MAVDTVWVKTHAALNDFMGALTCKKCHQRLRNPQQFLNCGHYACASCVGSKTDCVICNIPGEASDIYADREISDLIANLNTIAEAVGLSSEKDDEFEVPKSPTPTTASSSSKNVSKRNTRKAAKVKSIDDTLNTSICESVMSKSTFAVPKNIDKKNKKGETPLHIACRNDNYERVRILLDNGANPNTKDNAGWTPLQEAASFSLYDICKMLLKAGASVNMIGCDNRTALHDAVIADDCELVSLLLDNNASRNLCDKEGKKPKDHCKSKKMANLFKSLQESDNNTTDVSNDVTLNIDKTLNTLSDGKIVFFGSHLNHKNRKLLTRLSNERKVKVVNNLSPSVTHVIIESDTSGDNIVLTFDVLLTILYGKIFLNVDCLQILLDNENISSSNLSLFEINPPQLDDGPTRARENMEKQNPKLFNNCFFFFAMKSNDSIKYDGVSFTKDNLMRLVGAADGVILTREPRPEDIQGSLSPFHVAHEPKHSLYKCTHYIIYVPDNNSSHSNANRIIYNMSNLKTLPLMWFIESILRYKLLDPIHLGLIPE